MKEEKSLELINILRISIMESVVNLMSNPIAGNSLIKFHFAGAKILIGNSPLQAKRIL